MTRGGFFHLHLHLLLLLGPARREILLGRFRCWFLLRTRNELAATLTNDPASSYARYSDRATTGDHCVPAQALISIFPVRSATDDVPTLLQSINFSSLFHLPRRSIDVYCAPLIHPHPRTTTPTVGSFSLPLARPRKNSPADSPMILWRCISAGLCVYNANSRSGVARN